MSYTIHTGMAEKILSSFALELSMLEREDTKQYWWNKERSHSKLDFFYHKVGQSTLYSMIFNGN